MEINNFDKYLKDNGIEDFTNPVPYSHPTFINDVKLFGYLDDIIYNNKRVLIFGDPDPDGLLSVLQFIELFRRFSYSNFEVWDYQDRNHAINGFAVNHAIENKFDYIIILDVGTNDMANIKKLSLFGVIPIVIDHHVSNYRYEDYPESCVVINSYINNRLNAEVLYKLSAGCLVFSLLYKYSCQKGNPLEYLSCYGLITLYSDSVDMSPRYNRSVYYLATRTPMSAFPRFVKDFLVNTAFNRRFIEFTLVPKINSLFRAEEFDVLNKYFLNYDTNTFVRADLFNRIKEIHESKRKMVDRTVDQVDREVLKNFVIVNLSSAGVSEIASKLYNYTGVIANSIAQEYGKPCIVLCDTGTGVKGSFRDLLSRNYLSIFEQFCKCGGHPPAFGIHLNYIEVNSFLSMIRETVDKKFFIYGLEDNIVVDMNVTIPDVTLLNRIASYNEFSGITHPVAIIRKRNIGMKELSHYGRDYYRYKWGDLVVESQHKLVLGNYVKIKPVFSKNLRLVSQTRGL